MLGVLILVAFMYVPGFLCLRALNLQSTLSVALAPVISACLYVVWGIVAYRVGVFATWSVIVVPVFLFSLVLFAVCLFRKRRAVHERIAFGLHLDWRLMLVVLVVNALVACIYLIGLDGANSFNQGYDAAHHLSQIAASISQGNFSTLDVDIDDAGTGVFYPSVFHIMAALLVSCMGISTAMAANATVYFCLACVFPQLVYVMASRMFDGFEFAPFTTSLLTLAFVGCPWILLRYCPLWPNAIGMMFLPAALALFMSCFSVSRGERTLAFCLTLVAFFTAAICHPNTVFTAGVFLLPYILMVLWHEGEGAELTLGTKQISLKYLLPITFALFAAALWIFIHSLPYFEGIVSFMYYGWASAPEMILRCLTQWMRHFSPQIPLAILVAIGAIAALRQKGLCWLVASYGLFFVLLTVCCSNDTNPLKSMLCGFWYNHDFRLMASFCFASLPLAGLGMATLTSWICGLASKRKARAVKKTGKALASALRATQDSKAKSTASASPKLLFGKSRRAVLVIACLFIITCFPCYVNLQGQVEKLPLAEVASKLLGINSWDGDVTIYHSEECAFVDEAVALLDDDAEVMNFPYDGSCYAYGYNGLNTYFHSNYVASEGGSDEWIVEHRLKDIARDPEVKEAAQNLGISYVILLDQGLDPKTATTKTREYNAEDWVGLNEITDDTPGFEVVLAEGDMRLYKIVALEDDLLV